MTKAEILEAINATIRPNNQKGITAESLANILTEMVNASAESGGGSGGSSGGGSGYYIDFTLADPTNPDSLEVTPEAMAHNAQLYATLMSVYNAGNMAAVGPVSTIFSDSGIITSNAVMFYSDAITVVYALPMELSNVMVNAVDVVTGGATTAVIGLFATVAIVLMSDGSLQPMIPGLM